MIFARQDRKQFWRWCRLEIAPVKGEVGMEPETDGWRHARRRSYDLLYRFYTVEAGTVNGIGEKMYGFDT
jgi:hypothetical protein